MFRQNGNIQSVFDQKADQTNYSHNYSGRVGIDYTNDKKTTIGFLVNGISNSTRWQNNGRADIMNGNGVYRRSSQ